MSEDHPRAICQGDYDFAGTAVTTGSPLGR